MSQHPLRTLIETCDAAISRRDFDALMAFYAEDAPWWCGGVAKSASSPRAVVKRACALRVIHKKKSQCGMVFYFRSL